MKTAIAAVLLAVSMNVPAASQPEGKELTATLICMSIGSSIASAMSSRAKGETPAQHAEDMRQGLKDMNKKLPVERIISPSYISAAAEFNRNMAEAVKRWGTTESSSKVIRESRDYFEAACVWSLLDSEYID